MNLAAVIMAVLYGNGDFDYSLMIANSAGWDNKKWKEPLMNIYRNINRDNMPTSEPISEIAIRTQEIAEKLL
ncbi:hypothetical protein KEJ34_08910 [Candidatus Bathyarchaeota archaeon]|nr:hypothetical protein [Candidatus Bathyarchaeota archaeon]